MILIEVNSEPEVKLYKSIMAHNYSPKKRYSFWSLSMDNLQENCNTWNQELFVSVVYTFESLMLSAQKLIHYIGLKCKMIYISSEQ